MSDYPKVSWVAPEYVKNPRTADWYWGTGLLGVVGVFACVYFGNYLFGGVVALSAFLIIMFAAKPVFEYPVDIYDDSIAINNKRIPFDKIDAYWLYRHPIEGVKLLLKSDAVALPFYVIPLADRVEEEYVREVLKDNVVESELKIPILLQVFEAIF